MKKLCILVPTYKRKECVEEFIMNHVSICLNNGIDLVFADSSPDDATENLITTYQQKGFSNLKYIRYIEQQNPWAEIDYECKSLADYKVFQMQKKLAESYEYIWLCGDGIRLYLSLSLAKIQRYMEDDVDIIHLSPWEMCPNGEALTYTDCNEFYVTYGWHMTLFGASIVASRVYRTVNNSEILKKYNGSGFLNVMSIYEYCATGPFTAIHIDILNADSSSSKKESGWLLGGMLFPIWAKNWVEANLQLPASYGPNRQTTIRWHSRGQKTFEWPRILEMRDPYGNITLKKVLKYRRYIPYVTDVPVSVFLAISLIPVPIAQRIYWNWIKRR